MGGQMERLIFCAETQILHTRIPKTQEYHVLTFLFSFCQQKNELANELTHFQMEGGGTHFSKKKKMSHQMEQKNREKNDSSPY